MSDPNVIVATFPSSIGITLTITRTDGLITEVVDPNLFVPSTRFDPETGLPVIERQPIIAEIASSQITADFDDTKPWTSETRDFGADGTLLRITRTLDDGDAWMRVFGPGGQSVTFRSDLSDTKPWSQATINRSEDGEIENRLLYRDDGVAVNETFGLFSLNEEPVTYRSEQDWFDAYDWLERELYFDDAGQKVYSIVIRDDGTTIYRTFDTDGEVTAKLVEDTADIREFEFVQTDYAEDGGRTVTTDFDDGRLVERVFDANGVLRVRRVEDVDDAYDYDQIESTFDASGDLISRIVTPDPTDDVLA